MKRLLTLFFSVCLAMTVSAQGWPSNYGGVMLQGFYWDSYDDTKWTNLESQADELSKYFSLVWIPQSARATNPTSMGYDDLYWFTNYNSSFGNEAQLLSLISTFKNKGIGTIADVVINHRGTVANWFDFPTETYNGVTYSMTAADVVKDDDKGKAQTAATAQGVSLSGNIDSGEGWDGMRDLDHNSANVQKTVKAYLRMLLEKFGYAGFRYDMTKGYAAKFTGMYNTDAKPQFSVGESWYGESSNLKNWVDGTKVNNVIQSAAFDFAIRYTAQKAANSGNWAMLDGDGLAKQNGYSRYAVTFVENHDTEYRSSTAQQDPLKKDTLAANAYILAMPGTPCVFLKHWQAYKNDIKNMIDARKLVGIHNESTFSRYSSASNYYALQTNGTNGKLLAVMGSGFVPTARWIKLTGGYHWAYYIEKNSMSTAWADLASGTYDGEQTVTLTAVTGEAGAQLVYTTNGSEPTASSTKVANGTKITIPAGVTTTLKVGLLINGVVSGVITRTYDVVDFTPYAIKVYVNADDADASWASAKMTAASPKINFWFWGGSHATAKGSWPGDAVTATETVDGKKYFVKEFQITNSTDVVNFVFSVGTGAPQTVNVENVKETTLINITSEKEGANYKVKTTTTGIEDLEVAENERADGDPYYYTLSGQRIAKPTQRGIYIHKGKKILVK